MLVTLRIDHAADLAQERELLRTLGRLEEPIVKHDPGVQSHVDVRGVVRTADAQDGAGARGEVGLDVHLVVLGQWAQGEARRVGRLAIQRGG